MESQKFPKVLSGDPPCSLRQGKLPSSLSQFRGSSQKHLRVCENTIPFWKLQETLLFTFGVFY